MLALSSQEITAGAAVIAALAAIAGAFLAVRNTRRSVEASEMPLLIAAPVSDEGWLLLWASRSDGPYRLNADIMNLGKGPAMLGDIRLVVNGQDLIAPAGGEIPISAGERRTLPFQALGEPPGDGRGTLRIYYTHALGARYMTRCEAVIFDVGILCKDFKRSTSDEQSRRFTH